MKRQTMINRLDQLDEQLTLRTKAIGVLAKDSHETLKKVPPVWLIGTGVAAGALVGFLGPTQLSALSIQGSRLIPFTRDAFALGQQFGASE